MLFVDVDVVGDGRTAVNVLHIKYIRPIEDGSVIYWKDGGATHVRDIYWQLLDTINEGISA